MATKNTKLNLLGLLLINIGFLSRSIIANGDAVRDYGLVESPFYVELAKGINSLKFPRQ